MKLHQYIETNFKGYNLNIPAFYLWDIGIRFELGNPNNSPFIDQEKEKYNELYFSGSLERAVGIFESAFTPEDNVILVFQSVAYNRRRIRKNNFCFKQIEKFNHSNVEYRKVYRFYELDGLYGKWNRSILNTKTKYINYKNILSAISNLDFRLRTPQIGGEVFFINTTKNLILNMYDDRGLDIISKEKSTLAPIYEKFNSWILDYDREKINQVFM